MPKALNSSFIYILTESDNYMATRGEHKEVRAFERQILEAENQIAKAISDLFDQENILQAACYEIKSQLGFDFVGISLVAVEQNTIESVYGIGIAEHWANRAKHYLEEDPSLRDIQADIVKTGRTEIISGWDNRFDRWIYETFGQAQMNRIFTPIPLMRDKSGRVLRNWFEHFDWAQNFILENNESGEHRIVINTKFSPDIASFQVIGTIEAGYQNSTAPIPFEKAIELAKIVARQALDIHRTRLHYVLELIAENTRNLLQADLVTLHFLLEPHQNYYVYQIYAGKTDTLASEVSSLYLNEQEVGWQAMRERQPKAITSCVESFNLSAHKGPRALVAFPLLIDRNKQKVIRHSAVSDISVGEATQQDIESDIGVLYVHFNREHEFTEDEIHRGEFLAERVVDAIWHAMTYQQVQDKARQLAALHSVTQSISQIPENGDLLSYIAWNTLNVLAADVVTIYAYLQSERKFLTPPSIAGWLKVEEKMRGALYKENVPFSLIELEQNIYVSAIPEMGVFKDSSFAKRESIKSVAGILLRVDEDVVGVMFINYRRSHNFSIEEKQIIQTLTSSAAIAIKNQRWLNTLNNIEREIITTLEIDKLLNLIVQRAVLITGADLGVVRRLEPISQDLIAQARYPTDEPIDQVWTRISIGEGIEGRVAQHRKPELVENVQTNPRYVSYFTNTLSEICVPLLGRDSEEFGVIGVLNVESRKKAFNQRDLKKLEVLADLAVIAIQNAESKKKLAKMEVMATLGELTSQLLHRMNNDVGASKVLLREIVAKLDKGDIESSKGGAEQTLQLVNRISQNLGGLKNWQQEKPKLVDLNQTVSKALSQIRISHEYQLKVDLPPHLPKVFCGEQQLLGVFHNIIQNAIDAMPNGGTLHITAKSVIRKDDNWVEICFSDTGLGMPEENLEKIFELGFTTKNTQGSMGFGLWWTQSQIESLGGQLTVSSELGGGSQFTVVIPMYKLEYLS